MQPLSRRMILIISESDFGYYQNYTSDNIRNALMGDDICSSAETATKKNCAWGFSGGESYGCDLVKNYRIYHKNKVLIGCGRSSRAVQIDVRADVRADLRLRTRASTIRTVCSMRKEEPQQAPPRHSSTGLLMPCQTDRRSLAQRSRSLRTPHNAPDRNYP